MMLTNWKCFRKSEVLTLCMSGCACNANWQRMKKRRGGCGEKWLEVQLSAQIKWKWWAQMSTYMDGEIRTAVEGVDPGEPRQAMSTDGLHPPFLSLWKILSSALTSFLLLYFFLRGSFFPLMLEKQLSSLKKKWWEAFGKNIKRYQWIRWADRQGNWMRA